MVVSVVQIACTSARDTRAVIKMSPPFRSVRYVQHHPTFGAAHLSPGSRAAGSVRSRVFLHGFMFSQTEAPSQARCLLSEGGP